MLNENDRRRYVGNPAQEGIDAVQDEDRMRTAMGFEVFDNLCRRCSTSEEVVEGFIHWDIVRKQELKAAPAKIRAQSSAGEHDGKAKS